MLVFKQLYVVRMIFLFFGLFRVSSLKIFVAKLHLVINSAATHYLLYVLYACCIIPPNNITLYVPNTSLRCSL